MFQALQLSGKLSACLPHPLPLQGVLYWELALRYVKSALDPLLHLSRGGNQLLPFPTVSLHLLPSTPAASSFPILWALLPLGPASPQPLKQLGQGQSSPSMPHDGLPSSPSLTYTYKYKKHFDYLGCYCHFSFRCGDSTVRPFLQNYTVNLHAELIGYPFISPLVP